MEHHEESEDEIRADMEDHDRELRAADELIRKDREEGLEYGADEMEAMGNQIKRMVDALDLGERIEFTRVDPNEQEDHRWFTISKPVDQVSEEDRNYIERAPGLAQTERGKRILRAARELYGTAKPLLVEIGPAEQNEGIIFTSGKVVLSHKDYAAVLEEQNEASRLDLRVMRTWRV